MAVRIHAGAQSHKFHRIFICLDICADIYLVLWDKVVSCSVDSPCWRCCGIFVSLAFCPQVWIQGDENPALPLPCAKRNHSICFADPTIFLFCAPVSTEVAPSSPRGRSPDGTLGPPTRVFVWQSRKSLCIFVTTEGNSPRCFSFACSNL